MCIYVCYRILTESTIPPYYQTPTKERREALKKKYFFDCDCGDCTSSNDATHFVARCPKCDHHQRCNMIQGPGAACGHQTTGEERTRHTVGGFILVLQLFGQSIACLYLIYLLDLSICLSVNSFTALFVRPFLYLIIG